MYVSSDFRYLAVAFGARLKARHYIGDSDILDVFINILCDVCVYLEMYLVPVHLLDNTIQ